jgi:hypothetical protein
MDGLLALSFIALALTFAIWNTVAVVQQLAYRRIGSTAELTWLPPRPWFYNLCLGIGFFMVSLTAISIFLLERPLMTEVAQALMAIYYTILFPLSFRIRRGLYATGIWTEGGFVPYSRVRALDWIEKPNVVLVLKTDGLFDAFNESYRRLPVPGELYGQVRRVLASHIEDHSLTVRKSVLGLSDSETPAQEQV